eukprot:1143845-Pelagomonas_calceolata.AAC.1
MTLILSELLPFLNSTPCQRPFISASPVLCYLQVWGLDFGDCHRSLFAHGDAVMGVHFVPKTHYVFTVGKDKLLKYWDVDRQAQMAAKGLLYIMHARGSRGAVPACHTCKGYP